MDAIMNLGIVPVAAITVICFLVGMGLKNFGKIDKWIPFACGAIGGIIGLIGYLTNFQEIQASHPIVAIGIGIISGFASTGVHQAVKQVKGDKTND